jgi:hypothetical protein
MRLGITHSLEIDHFYKAKDTKFDDQLTIIYQAFLERPMTMKEADVQTGIMRENICRYVGALLQSGRIAIRKRRRCSITGYPNVKEYTADPDLFPSSNQLKLF